MRILGSLTQRGDSFCLFGRREEKKYRVEKNKGVGTEWSLLKREICGHM